MSDLYQILGVSQNATLDTIKQAFRTKVKLAHPDSNPDASPDEFHKLNEAYMILSDDKKRLLYDLRLKHGTISRPVYYRPGSNSGNTTHQYKPRSSAQSRQKSSRVEKLIDLVFITPMVLTIMWSVGSIIYRWILQPVGGGRTVQGEIAGILFSLGLLYVFFAYYKSTRSNRK